MPFLRLLTLFVAVVLSTACLADEYTGASVDLDGRRIKVSIYEPSGCKPAGLMFVFHGFDVSPKYYFKSTRPISDRICLATFFPVFGGKHFPAWRYALAGMVRNGKLLPRERWTSSLVLRLVDWARQREKLPDAPIYMIGHSAGGQLMARIAAFVDVPHAARLVVMSAGSEVLPSLVERVPFGLAGLASEEDSRQRLAAYLAQPLTIYVGGEDTNPHGTNNSRAGRRQGRTRIDRARYAYKMAQEMAEKYHLPCNWTYVEAKGVGHSGEHMLTAPEVWQALKLPPP